MNAQPLSLLTFPCFCLSPPRCGTCYWAPTLPWWTSSWLFLPFTQSSSNTMISTWRSRTSGTLSEPCARRGSGTVSYIISMKADASHQYPAPASTFSLLGFTVQQSVKDPLSNFTGILWIFGVFTKVFDGPGSVWFLQCFFFPPLMSVWLQANGFGLGGSASSHPAALGGDFRTHVAGTLWHDWDWHGTFQPPEGPTRARYTSLTDAFTRAHTRAHTHAAHTPLFLFHLPFAYRASLRTWGY